MVLKPFTLFEPGESSGIVSLKDLLEGDGACFEAAFERESPAELEDVAFDICIGGWPIALKAKKEYAIEAALDDDDALFRTEDKNDDFGLFLKGKNIGLLELILKCYARNISSQAKKTKMIADIFLACFDAMASLGLDRVKSCVFPCWLAVHDLFMAFPSLTSFSDEGNGLKFGHL